LHSSVTSERLTKLAVLILPHMKTKQALL